MAWLRIDDTMPDHPKVAGLSDAAFRAHVTALCYCARHLTDGQIPTAIANQLAPNSVSKELQLHKLWRRNRGGYSIKNYLEYNPSKAEVESGRKARTERARAGGYAKAKAAKSLLEAEPKQRFKQPVSTDNAPAPIPIPSPLDDHPHTSGESQHDHQVKADDLTPNVRHEIERLAGMIPDGGRSVGRLVKAARAGAPQAAFADARQALSSVTVPVANPGAWACKLVEGYGRNGAAS